MAEEISKPLCEANKVTMVSSGNGEVGAAKLSGEVLDIMTRLPETVEKLTGVSISQVTQSCALSSYTAYWFIFFCLVSSALRGEKNLDQSCIFFVH